MLSLKYMHNLPNPQTSGDDSRVAQSVGSTNKETLVTSEQPPIEEIASDVELSPELEEAGVLKRSETIDLPLDVTNLGVTGTGHAQPLSTADTIQLPLDDQQIITGRKAKLTSSWRWLAEWCLFRLKKAHIALKVVAGKIVRKPA